MEQLQRGAVARVSTQTRALSVPMTFGLDSPPFAWATEPGRFASLGCVERCACADERLEGCGVDLVTLVEVDGSPHGRVQARIEECVGIVDRGTFREGEFDLVLVGLARADDAIETPGGYAERVGLLLPLGLLDHLGYGLYDQVSNVGQHVATPVA